MPKKNVTPIASLYGQGHFMMSGAGRSVHHNIQWSHPLLSKEIRMPWFSLVAENEQVISEDQIRALCVRLLDEARSRLGVDFRRVLLLPPDKTRAHSGAGAITEMLFGLLPKTCDTHVIP